MPVLLTAPSLQTIAEFSAETVGEHVSFLTPTGKNEWRLERRDGSLIEGFRVLETGHWAFLLETVGEAA